MLSKSTICDYTTDLFHCDFTGHLFLGNLGNDMLNVADRHSSERGYGVTYLQTLDATWVVSRLAIEMERMPVAHEKFTLETWIESAMRFFTSRNFEVKSSDGNVLGYGRSIWAMINTQTRQPMNIFDINNGVIKDYVMPEKTCPIARPGRVTMTDDAEFAGEITVKYGDLDVNGHLNSVQYIRHVLDLFTHEWYENHRIQRFEIAYVSEGHYGEKLQFYRQTVEEGEYNIEIKRNDGDNCVVLCRCKVKFVNN